MSQEEFRCRAINDYYASVTDELDLKEGAEYTVMQTSPSGWWYAVNDDGEDGWVPSNYLVRVDDEDGDNDNQEDDGKEENPTYSDEDDNTNQEDNNDYNDNTNDNNNNDNYNDNSSNNNNNNNYQQQSSNKKKDTTKIVVNQNNYNTDIKDGAPDKPITEWDVDETLGYLKNASKLERRNDFKVTQACRYLTQLATDTNNCARIAASGGLDIIFKVMQATLGDVAIQMSCCAATVVLCANPSSKQYPATVNGIYHISQGIKDNINYRPFVVLAFNAVCNFCHDHPRHRSMALETDIIAQVLKGMAHHCGKDEGYKVVSAGCLALRNVAADPKGQGAIGPDGVKVILEGLEEYRNIREVVENSMGVLCNLCALAANGEAFVMQGGLQILENLFLDPDCQDNVRLAAAAVLHNLAACEDTALLLSSDQGVNLLMTILKKSEVDSVLYLNTLKVLAALLFKLPNDNRGGNTKKPEVMKTILSKGLLASLNEAVQYDSKELQEMVATILVVIAQTKPDLAQTLADGDAPEKLIGVCMHEPTIQTTHCSLAIFFHVCDNFGNQKSLVEKNIFGLLVSDWYKRQGVSEDTVRIGCGVFVKLFANNANDYYVEQNKDGIREFIRYNKENRKDLEMLLNGIQNKLEQLENSDKQGSSGNYVQTTYSQKDNSNNNEQKEEPKQNKVQSTKEIKQIRKQSKLRNDNIETQSVQSQPTNSTGKTHNETAPNEPPDTGSQKLYSYEELLKNKNKLPKNQLEAYLQDEDFEKVFGMEKEAFYKKRPWQQKMLKKQKGLW